MPGMYSAGLRILCLGVLIGMLVAGLWPFHSPRNDVKWSGDGRGLVFGKYGIVLSAEPFRTRKSETNAPCSLEVWLEPAKVDRSGTIFAYYQPDHRFAQIWLRQFKSHLVLSRGEPNPRRHFAGIYKSGVFRAHNPVLLSITTGESGTDVYADGTLLKRSQNIKFSAEDLNGQLIFGNAPGTTDFWSGTLRGFAAYDRELSADEVRQHFAEWTRGDQKSLAGLADAIAVYSFSENTGTVVHNSINSATSLLIPGRFFVPHKQFLEAPWDEFHPSWSYWKSFIVNVVGFIPFGLIFYALFDSQSDIGQPMFATIALGFAVSLTIEVLQGFLPTRSSGTTDLFTNTFGTAVGAIAYTSAAVRSWIGRIGRYPGIPEGITK